MSHSSHGAQHYSALICMQIMHLWSKALTITYFLEGQRICSPFLIASQLTNYPKNVVQSVSKQQQHCTFRSLYSLLFVFINYNEDRVTMATKTPFLSPSIKKFTIKQRLCLHRFQMCPQKTACQFDTCDQQTNGGTLHQCGFVSPMTASYKSRLITWKAWKCSLT